MTKEEIKEFAKELAEVLKNQNDSSRGDHDLLVEVKTMLKGHLDQYDKDRIQTANDISANTKSSTSAHKRIDMMYVGCIIIFVVCVVTIYFNFVK